MRVQDAPHGPITIQSYAACDRCGKRIGLGQEAFHHRAWKQLVGFKCCIDALPCYIGRFTTKQGREITAGVSWCIESLREESGVVIRDMQTGEVIPDDVTCPPDCLSAVHLPQIVEA